MINWHQIKLLFILTLGPAPDVKPARLPAGINMGWHLEFSGGAYMRLQGENGDSKMVCGYQMFLHIIFRCLAIIVIDRYVLRFVQQMLSTSALMVLC